MSSQPNQDIENVYMDYLQESQRIFKEQQRKNVVPYLVVALVLFLVSGASFFAGFFGMISSRAGSWLYWVGLVIAKIVGVAAVRSRFWFRQPHLSRSVGHYTFRR